MFHNVTVEREKGEKEQKETEMKESCIQMKECRGRWDEGGGERIGGTPG